MLVAADRAAAVLGGGALQIAIVVVLARLVPSARAPLLAAAAKPPPGRRLLYAHMARAVVCVAVALVAARALGLANSYWAPMTAIIVLKPGHAPSLWRRSATSLLKLSNISARYSARCCEGNERRVSA